MRSGSVVKGRDQRESSTLGKLENLVIEATQVKQASRDVNSAPHTTPRVRKPAVDVSGRSRPVSAPSAGRKTGLPSQANSNRLMLTGERGQKVRAGPALTSTLGVKGQSKAALEAGKEPDADELLRLLEEASPHKATALIDAASRKYVVKNSRYPLLAQDDRPSSAAARNPRSRLLWWRAQESQSALRLVRA
jgi:hypothetical protein